MQGSPQLESGGDSEAQRLPRPPSSCFWCGGMHHAEHPLSVCPACAARFRTMRLLEMRGSYPLDASSIDGVLSRTSPGNYALGYMDGDAFAVFYVGRSDVDVRGRLHEWVGMPSATTRAGFFAKAAWCVQRRGPLPVDAPKLGPVVHGDGSYTRFAFSYAASATAAFERECRNYDDFGGSQQLDNDGPPAEPPHRVVRSSSAVR